MQADVCTWQFEKVAADAFNIDYRSAKLTNNAPKRLSFKIVNPVRIRNVDQNYEAFRIVCPPQELEGQQKDLENRQRLAAADIGNLTNQRDLATSHIVVGDVLAAQGRHKDAIEHYVRGSEIRRNLAVADPGNQAWQRDLAIGYDRIGQAHQILGENAEALESYKSSVAVRQKLYLANRRDFTNQHELAGAFERVGGLRKTLGDSKLALAAYQQSVLLRQELADAYRDNAQLQSELAVSLYLSSTVSEAPAAKDALLKALAVLESLERDQKLTSSQATWPRFIRGEIAKLH